MRFYAVCLVAALLLISGCAEFVEESDNPFGLFVSASLPAWVSGQSGSASIVVAGGTPPYACSLKGGSFPAWLYLAKDCVISGKAPKMKDISDRLGAMQFTINVADSSEPVISRDVNLSVTVVSPSPVFIPVVTGRCAVGQICRAQVASAIGGIPNYLFKADDSSALPPGASLSSDGNIMGKPSREGVYNFKVCVSDATAASDCGNTSVSVESLLAPVTLAAKKQAALPPLDMYVGSFQAVGNFNDDLGCQFQTAFAGKLAILFADINGTTTKHGIVIGIEQDLAARGVNSNTCVPRSYGMPFQYKIPLAVSGSRYSFSGGNVPIVDFVGNMSPAKVISGRLVFKKAGMSGSAAGDVLLTLETTTR